jgi:uncharacterized membrane protein
LTTTVHASFGVVLESTAAAQVGAPGTTVLYALEVTNLGNGPDLLDLAFQASSDWDVSLSLTSVALEARQGAEVHVTVQVPLDAQPGQRTAVTITATSRGDPRVSASLTLVTTVNGQIFLPLVVKGHW